METLGRLIDIENILEEKEHLDEKKNLFEYKIETLEKEIKSI